MLSSSTAASVLANQFNPAQPLLVKKLSEFAQLPTKGSPLAAGYDLYAAKEMVIKSMDKVKYQQKSKLTSSQKPNAFLAETNIIIGNYSYRYQHCSSNWNLRKSRSTIWSGSQALSRCRRWSC
jgi:hypothetical protein